MGEAKNLDKGSSFKRGSELARTVFKVGMVVAGGGLFLNIVNVQIPKMSSQLEDAMPGLTRDFLLWLATDKTISEINSFAAEWSGLLTLLGIGLAVIFYFLSLPDRSKIKEDKG
jgi:hypothetical protein